VVLAGWFSEGDGRFFVYSGGGDGLRIDPFAVLADEGDEAVVGLVLGQVILHAGLADVEIDFSGSAADVAEIGVGHLAGAVYDAAHDGDFDAFEVSGAGADALGGGLQVEEGASAGGAGDEFGLGDAGAGALEDVVGEFGGANGVGFGFDGDEVAEAVAQEGAGEGGGVEQAAEEVVGG